MKTRRGATRILVEIASCLAFGGAPAVAGSIDLQVATSEGCGLGVLVPAAATSLSVTIRADALPAGNFPVQIALQNAGGQEFTASTTLSGETPERTVVLPFGPFPPGPVSITVLLPGLGVGASCVVTASADVPNSTATPTATPTATTAAATPSPTVTETGGTPVSTATPIASPTSTSGVGPSATVTPTASVSPTPFGPSASPTPSGTPTASPTATSTSSLALRGDANCDGTLNAADLTEEVALVTSAERAPCGLDDADGDGVLAREDIEVVVVLLFGG